MLKKAFSMAITLGILVFAGHTATAACVNGERMYDPAADKNESRFEVCVNGRWTKEGSGAYVSSPTPFVCKEGSKFYDPAADGNEPRWSVCRGGKSYKLTVDGKIIPRASANPIKCKEGSGFYDPAAEDGAPRFYVCRAGRYVARGN